ncbi:MAG: SAM-dependent methyltransferase, partial [Lacrimispora sp.]
MKETGVVYLVGAGPGDPGLITEKGLSRLRACDVVVYDSLISDRLLEEVPEGCRKIYVGKRAGAHSMKQEDI